MNETIISRNLREKITDSCVAGMHRIGLNSEGVFVFTLDEDKQLKKQSSKDTTLMLVPIHVPNSFID